MRGIFSYPRSRMMGREEGQVVCPSSGQGEPGTGQAHVASGHGRLLL